MSRVYSLKCVDAVTTVTSLGGAKCSTVTSTACFRPRGL